MFMTGPESSKTYKKNYTESKKSLLTLKSWHSWQKNFPQQEMLQIWCRWKTCREQTLGRSCKTRAESCSVLVIQEGPNPQLLKHLTYCLGNINNRCQRPPASRLWDMSTSHTVCLLSVIAIGHVWILGSWYNKTDTACWIQFSDLKTTLITWQILLAQIYGIIFCAQITQ